MKPTPFLLLLVALSGLSVIAPHVVLAENVTYPQAVEVTLDSSNVIGKDQNEHPDKAPLEVGTRLPITIETLSTSKTAQIGDIINAHLCDDLNFGGRVLAPKGARVQGHVCSVQKARKVLKAELSRRRWMKSAGELGVQFDEIVT